MKKTLKNFEKYMAHIERAMKEREKVQKAIEVLAPGAVYEYGNDLIDHYIALMEDAFDIKNEDISWFVFENDFGRNGYNCWCKGELCQIKSAKDMFNFIQKCNDKQKT